MADAGLPDDGKVALAVDLGASGGRVIAGAFDGRRIAMHAAHRFENGPVTAGDRMVWNLLGQWQDVQNGLQRAASDFGSRVASVGVDTWGVDFALLGRGDELLGNPYHYRDRRTAGIMPRAFEIVPREEIFAATGLQFMELNTLFQLIAMREQNSPLLDVAERLLMMPDVFHWLLTGEKSNEMTDVSTSQMYDPQTGDWAKGLVERFGLPTKILGAISPPGTRLGRLRPSVAQDVGLAGVEVILPGAHDTASAVLAVPATSGGSWCYISSGTWSLMGVELPRPVVNTRACALNFTNEGGVGGTVRLLKNIAGLWLVQECRRIWSRRGKAFDWETLVGMAQAARPHAVVIDPDDSRFTAPDDMPAAIADYCRATGQTPPVEEGATIRAILESLALRYRQVLASLEELTGGMIDAIHIVGGGSQNELLSQMAADACDRRVLAGPMEATATGNLLMQFIALGEVNSIAQAREIVRASFAVREYAPANRNAWDEAYARFERLTGR